MSSVLEFVEDSLKFVPNTRREAMTLGDYLQRHSYIGQTQEYSRDEHITGILKNKI